MLHNGLVIRPAAQTNHHPPAFEASQQSRPLHQPNAQLIRLRAMSDTETATQLLGRPDHQPPKNKGGRQSTYTPEMAQRICDHIAGGGYATDTQRFGLPHVCTINKWLNENEAFAAAYARAREARAETFANQIIEIADTEEDPARARVRVEARKWVASKLFPRMYGENQRVEVQHTLSETAARVLSELSQRQKERKAEQAKYIDITPEHSPREGVVAERNALTSFTIDADDAGTARVSHGQSAVDEAGAEPPAPPTTGAPAAAAASPAPRKRRQK